MARVLEAEARISATDRTGNVFGRIADKMRAINRAGDAVNGYSGRLAAIGEKAGAAGRKLTAVGRGMTVGIGLPAAMAGRSILHSLHDFELASNKLKAFGELNDEQLRTARETAKRYGRDYAFGPEGVIKGMVEQIKAGFEPRHLEAIQKPILDFATLAEIEIPKASELAIFALAGFGKMYDKTGKMLGAAELNTNLRQLIDLFAILNKVAPGNIEGISETFKYAAAAAAQLKVAPEQLGAFTAVLAQAGILGPEAGVALRSMMVRFLKPTRPALAAASAIGMKIDDYVIKNPELLKPENILGAVEQQTGTLSKKQRGRLLGDLGKLGGLEGEGYEKGLIAAIRRIGKGDLKDADTAGDLATRIMGTAIEKIDIMRFLKDAAGKAPNFAAFMAQFMDQRQAVRLANLDNARVTYMLTQMEEELTKARERGGSVSRDMADKINSGLIDSENKLRGSYQNLVQTIGETGMTDAAIKTMDGLASGLKSIAELNPKILEFSTYAAGAAVAIGPLVWFVGKLSSAAGVLSKLILAVAPAAANPVVAGGLLTAGAIGTLHDETKPYEGLTSGERLRGQRGGSMNDARRRAFNAERARLGLPELQTPPPPAAPPAAPPIDPSAWDRSAAGGPAWDPSNWAKAVRDGLAEAPPAKAELTGNADVNVKVEVVPSADFMTRIQSMISNAITNVRVNGAPPSGTAGSTGKAMPEAGPAP
ncbi:phage tail tape measure protein [Xanthobacteraceae bacterium Astr-EGSB]|uniref:phage tail tape measure protein n=1 Tax=Astrobacterium formosum TaxID=3069710 RepID=UPI0027B0DF86|nr:phage tail tape measure protein [Xanthobacteraceae bacterium Astr-EGSB]